MLRNTRLAIAFLAVVACGAARAEPYAGIGVAAFDGVGNFDRNSTGAHVFAGWQLRPWLAIEAGAIDQGGDTHYPEIPAEFSEYGWRALHLGPRVEWPLGERWHLHAGLSLAHVSIDREHALFFTVDQDTPNTITEGVSYRDASFGAFARLGLSFDLTPRQSLGLEVQRLHAGLQERCEPVQIDGATLHQCGHLGYASSDGAALSWRIRLD